MLSGQWEEEEGGWEGNVDMHGGEGWGGGEILYLSSLPPYKPRSWAVSQQARNKRGAYFSIWGTKGIGHGGETIQPLKKKKKSLASRAQIALQRKRRGGDSVIGESFIHAGRQSIPERDRDFGTGRWRSDPKTGNRQITGYFREFHIMTASLGMYEHAHVCQGALCDWMIYWIISSSSLWTLSPFPFLRPSLTRRFPLGFSAHSLSCLYSVISASVPPGNFKEGTHAQNPFTSLLQAAGICKQLLEFLSDAFSLFQTHSPPSKVHPSRCLFVHENTFFSVLDGSICTPPLTSHTRWDDEMVCSTASFMISSC